MKNNFDLNNMGLMEMNQTELEETKGGGWFGALIGAVVGAVVGLFVDISIGPEEGRPSYEAGSTGAILWGAAIGAAFGAKFIPI